MANIPALLKKKSVLAVIGVSSLAVLGGTAFLLKDRFIASNDLPSSDEIVLAMTPDPIPEETPASPERHAIVIEDNVKGYADYLAISGEPKHLFMLGDQVQIWDVKVDHEFTWYRAKTKDADAWIDSKYTVIFDETALFENFVSSTEPVNELASNAQNGSSEVGLLGTKEFWFRAARNKDEFFSGVAQRRLFGLVGDGDIVSTWFQLAKDKNVKNLDETNTQLSMLFSSGRASTAGSDFTAQFASLPAEAKSRIFNETCYGAVSSRDLFEGILETMGREPSASIYQQFVNCLNEEIVNKNENYVVAGTTAFLRDQAAVKGKLPDGRFQILKKETLDQLVRRPTSDGDSGDTDSDE